MAAAAVRELFKAVEDRMVEVDSSSHQMVSAPAQVPEHLGMVVEIASAAPTAISRPSTRLRSRVARPPRRATFMTVTAAPHGAHRDGQRVIGTCGLESGVDALAADGPPGTDRRCRGPSQRRRPGRAQSGARRGEPRRRRAALPGPAGPARWKVPRDPTTRVVVRSGPPARRTACQATARGSTRASLLEGDRGRQSVHELLRDDARSAKPPPLPERPRLAEIRQRWCMPRWHSVHAPWYSSGLTTTGAPTLMVDTPLPARDTHPEISCSTVTGNWSLVRRWAGPAGGSCADRSEIRGHHSRRFRTMRGGLDHSGGEVCLRGQIARLDQPRGDPGIDHPGRH